SATSYRPYHAVIHPHPVAGPMQRRRFLLHGLIGAVVHAHVDIIDVRAADGAPLDLASGDRATGCTRDRCRRLPAAAANLVAEQATRHRTADGSEHPGVVAVDDLHRFIGSVAIANLAVVDAARRAEVAAGREAYRYQEDIEKA